MKPVFLLVVLSTILPELLTGSSSVSAFFNPAHFVFLLIGYGLAALFVREVAVRNALSWGGVILLGAAFGIFNEGILAKTLIRDSGLPLAQYDSYGYIFGIDLPFSIVISLWHALASVLAPILITHWVFPADAKRSWLGKRAAAAIGILLCVAGAAYFLGPQPIEGGFPQLIAFMVAIVGLYLIAKKSSRRTVSDAVAASPSLKPLWLGLSVFIPLHLILGIIAGEKAPLIFFFGATAILFWMYARIIKKRGWSNQRDLMLFGIGNYIHIAILGGLVAFSIPDTLPERLAAAVLSVIALVFLAARVKRQGFGISRRGA